MALINIARALIRLWYRHNFGAFGKGSWLSPLGQYLHPKGIRVGDNVYVGARSIISATEGIQIGSGVVIGPEFVVMGGDHNFRTVGKRIAESSTGGRNEPIVIEDDVWIGARVLVLKGVRIGEGAIIGAGAVVTRSIPPYAVAAGNPARVIGRRFEGADLTAHLEAVGSRYRSDDLERTFRK